MPCLGHIFVRQIDLDTSPEHVVLSNLEGSDPEGVH